MIAQRAGAQAPAAAQPSGAELSWVRTDGAESCADSARLRAAVAERLGRDPFGAGAPLSVEAVAGREDGVFVARIYAREQDGAAIGSRTLRSEAETCDSLADAAALAIALVIDPDAVERTARARQRQAAAAAVARPAHDERAPAATGGAASAASAPPTPSAPPATPSAPPVATSAALDRASDGPREHAPGAGRPAWIDVRALGSAGLLPGGLAPGVSLSADLPVYGAWGARAELAYWPERETDSLNARFGFGLTAGALAACAHAPAAAAIAVALCAGGWLGSIHAIVYELEPTAPGDRLWGALSLAAELHARFAGRLRVSLGAQALAPLARHRFTVRGRESAVFRQSPIAGSALLGAGVSFW